jgi:hypothetical protein
VDRDREMGLAGGFKNLGLGYDGHLAFNIRAAAVKPNPFQDHIHWKKARQFW